MWPNKTILYKYFITLKCISIPSRKSFNGITKKDDFFFVETCNFHCFSFLYWMSVSYLIR